MPIILLQSARPQALGSFNSIARVQLNCTVSAPQVPVTIQLNQILPTSFHVQVYHTNFTAPQVTYYYRETP
jgi:hypothetical protein